MIVGWLVGWLVGELVGWLVGLDRDQGVERFLLIFCCVRWALFWLLLLLMMMMMMMILLLMLFVVGCMLLFVCYSLKYIQEGCTF